MPPRIVDLDVTRLDALLGFYRRMTPETLRYFDPFGGANEERIVEHVHSIEAGGDLGFGLLEGDRLDGHCFLLGLRGKHPVFGLGISPDYRGQGYGRALTETALSRTDRLGIGPVTLTVVRSNYRALRLYRSVGFRVQCMHTFRTEDDSYFMQREVRDGSGP